MTMRTRMKSWVVFVAVALVAAGCNERRSGAGAGTPSGGDVAAVASGAVSLDELLAADVVFEDLTPGVSFDGGDAAPTAGAPPTVEALFSLTPAGLALDVAIDRADGWTAAAPAGPEPGMLWRLEDPSTGATLAEGAFELPALCACGASEDHHVGCSRRSHSAVFALELPRLAPTQRLVIAERAGAVRGSWELIEPM